MTIPKPFTKLERLRQAVVDIGKDFPHREDALLNALENFQEETELLAAERERERCGHNFVCDDWKKIQEALKLPTPSGEVVTDNSETIENACQEVIKAARSAIVAHKNCQCDLCRGIYALDVLGKVKK